MKRRIAKFLAMGTALFGVLVFVHAAIPDRDLQESLDAFEQARGSKTVLMGASAGSGVDLNIIGFSGAEIWGGGEDIFETVGQARALLASDHEIETWILVLLPPAQALDNGQAGACCNHRRRERYRLLRANNDFSLINGDWQTAVASLVPAGLDDWSPMLDHLGLIEGKALSRQIALELSRRQSLAQMPSEASLLREIVTKQDEIEVLEYRNPDISGQATAALLSLQRAIASDGGSLIVIVSPVVAPLPHLMRQRMPESLQQFDAMLAALERNGALVINHWESWPGASDHRFFRDSVHLNGEGRTMYSRHLRSDLARNGAIARDAQNNDLP